MYNNEELFLLLTLARAMSGEANVLENMEKEGQDLDVRKTMLAKDMYPSKEVWEQVGFTFTDIPGDDVLCKATLPEGWSIKATDHSMWNEIIDAKGHVRGTMFYKAAFYDRSAHMSLNSRYRVHSEYIGEDSRTVEVYFGNAQEKIMVAGQVYLKRYATPEEKKEIWDKQNMLLEQATKFAQENYPDWQNVIAYWDEDRDLSEESSLSRKK